MEAAQKEGPDRRLHVHTAIRQVGRGESEDDRARHRGSRALSRQLGVVGAKALGQALSLYWCSEENLGCTSMRPALGA